MAVDRNLHHGLYPFAAYFGQPSAGLFFSSDFLVASCQFPSILRMSGLGPGLALPGLDRGDFFGMAAFYPNRLEKSPVGC